MNGPLVYIAGPYTSPDPVTNTRKAIDAWARLADAGIPAIVPHNSLMLNLVHPKPPQFWYDYDLAILKRCDAIVRLPGESRGADREMLMAGEWGVRRTTLFELLEVR